MLRQTDTANLRNTAGRHYRPDIDGLRAIAVLPVVAFHAFPQIFPGGFVGVDVFFVISGFLISQIIFHELHAKSFSLRGFYARRVRRLFPALMVVLAAILAAGWWALLPVELIRLGQQVVTSVAFVANLYLWFQAGYFDPAANTYPLLHLWSLGVEEQFYIFWPLLLILLWRRSRLMLPAIVLIGVATFLLDVIFASHRVAVFYCPVTRAWEFMLGAALAWMTFGKSPGAPVLPKFINECASLTGLILIGGAVALLNSDEPYPGWRALLPAVGATLILMSGGTSRIGSLIFAARPLVFVGLISYPLYLWHWPMLWLARLEGFASNAWRTIAVCIAAVILAWLTYEFIERPIRFGYRKRPGFVTASLVTGLAIAGVIGGLSSVDGAPARWNGAPGRWDKEILTLRDYAANLSLFTTQYQWGKCLLYPKQGPKDYADQCLGDNRGAEFHVVLWGDSSATALYLGMHALADGRYDIALLSSSACPPFLADYQFFADRPNCPAINAYILQHIQETRPDVVVLSTAPTYQNDMAKQMGATIAALQTIGVKTIVLVGPLPSWPIALPALVLQTYFNDSLKAVPHRLELPQSERDAVSRLDAQFGSVAAAAGAIYVSPFGSLCTEQLCTVMIDGAPVAWDKFHLTVAGSAFVARDIYGKLGKVPRLAEKGGAK